MKFIAVLILASLLSACGARSSDEQKVREIFASAEEAAEARDVGDVLELMSPDYQDSQGQTRAGLAAFLRPFFAIHPKLELLVNIESIEFPADGLAKARVTVRGLDLNRFDAGESVVLNVELRREDGDWLVTRADRARR